MPEQDFEPVPIDPNPDPEPPPPSPYPDPPTYIPPGENIPTEG